MSSEKVSTTLYDGSMNIFEHKHELYVLRKIIDAIDSGRIIHLPLKLFASVLLILSPCPARYQSRCHEVAYNTYIGLSCSSGAVNMPKVNDAVIIDRMIIATSDNIT